MTLRVVAVAPPGMPEGGLGEHTLKSVDPASLFNACRVAAERAERGIGAWADSNWAVSRHARRECLLLMHSLREDLPAFESLLERERPDLLLIGAMTVCLPGAVACAARAKEILGPEVVVVLGGRHPSESIYPVQGAVAHHPSSPVRLMAEGYVPPVFDLVVSGEAEHLIAELGEVLAAPDGGGTARDRLAGGLDRLARAPGRWIASRHDGGRIENLAGGGPDLARDLLPPPAALFGVRTAFDVFGGRLTGHVFSDAGNGCVFDCDFCSERRSVTGGLAQPSTGADRLMRQLRAVADVVAEDAPHRGASAFVEDSTLLGGAPRQIERLVRMLAAADLDLRFGGQLTIDQISRRMDLVKSLAGVGLDYVFIGVETLDPALIGGMNKDRRAQVGHWMGRTENAIAALADNGVRSGAAVLFGLGERQEHRLALLEELARWRRIHGSPDPISLNWATQHPLRDPAVGYRYHEWSVPAGEWTRAFADFGEASVNYPLRGVAPPVLGEVREVRAAFQELLVTGERATVNR
ncbi:hypothetical protein GCM10023085_49350 [Actinomadura viridis]|uniref:B12-binding domain/radical SAM domain-containing protein n=1 Tax=Actinomadura viridis TaxID=58110 RepID=UPI0018CB6C98|nr:B12-binding domain/radical SAM domain-containing protein [Actinomadura viridis]